MQTRSTERTGAGALLMGATKAEIRNAAATTSRCVGSDKSGQPELRPARDHLVHGPFCCGARSVVRTRRRPRNIAGSNALATKAFTANGTRAANRPSPSPCGRLARRDIMFPCDFILPVCLTGKVAGYNLILLV
jgi:hypothetical protein